MYERVVAAALAETQSKFEFAEELLGECAGHRAARADAESNLKATLREIRQAIIEAGGEARDVETLRRYYLTAKWVYRDGAFQWAPGVSFTAHLEAREKGLNLEDLAANPRSRDQIRAEAGRAPSNSIAKVVRNLSDEDRRKAVRELMKNPAAQMEVHKALDEQRDALHKERERADRARDAHRQADGLPPRREERDPRSASGIFGGLGVAMRLGKVTHQLRELTELIAGGVHPDMREDIARHRDEARAAFDEFDAVFGIDHDEITVENIAGGKG